MFSRVDDGEDADDDGMKTTNVWKSALLYTFNRDALDMVMMHAHLSPS